MRQSWLLYLLPTFVCSRVDPLAKDLFHTDVTKVFSRVPLSFPIGLNLLLRTSSDLLSLIPLPARQTAVWKAKLMGENVDLIDVISVVVELCNFSRLLPRFFHYLLDILLTQSLQTLLPYVSDVFEETILFIEGIRYVDSLVKTDFLSTDDGKFYNKYLSTFSNMIQELSACISRVWDSSSSSTLVGRIPFDVNILCSDCLLISNNFFKTSAVAKNDLNSSSFSGNEEGLSIPLEELPRYTQDVIELVCKFSGNFVQGETLTLGHSISRVQVRNAFASRKIEITRRRIKKRRDSQSNANSGSREQMITRLDFWASEADRLLEGRKAVVPFASIPPLVALVTDYASLSALANPLKNAIDLSVYQIIGGLLRNETGRKSLYNMQRYCLKISDVSRLFFEVLSRNQSSRSLVSVGSLIKVVRSMFCDNLMEGLHGFLISFQRSILDDTFSEMASILISKVTTGKDLTGINLVDTPSNFSLSYNSYLSAVGVVNSMLNDVDEDDPIRDDLYSIMSSIGALVNTELDQNVHDEIAEVFLLRRRQNIKNGHIRRSSNSGISENQRAFLSISLNDVTDVLSKIVSLSADHKEFFRVNNMKSLLTDDEVVVWETFVLEVDFHTNQAIIDLSKARMKGVTNACELREVALHLVAIDNMMVLPHKRSFLQNLKKIVSGPAEKLRFLTRQTVLESRKGKPMSTLPRADLVYLQAITASIQFDNWQELKRVFQKLVVVS